VAPWIDVNSSIFSFDHFRRYAALPAGERRWHALLTTALLLVMLISYDIPARLFGASGCQGPTLGSAAVASLSDGTELLFVGSSRVLFGIRPERYSLRATNLASTWLDYSCAHRLVQKHLSRVPGLKLAVIEYDELPLVSDLVPAMVAVGDLRPLTELALSPLEIPVDDWTLRLRVVSTAVSFRFTGLPRLTPLGWKHRGLPCSPIYRPAHGFAAGYYCTDMLTPASYDRDVVFKALEISARRERVVQRNVRALDETIGLLRRRGVTVVLLRLPHRPEYVNGLPAVVRARWEDLRDRMRREARADDRLLLLDWADRPEFQAGDFADEHHLNVFGADKLARLLDPELRALCR
jgi:hypothetical protein